MAYFIDFFLVERSPITPLMEKNYSLSNFYVTKAKLDGLVETVWLMVEQTRRPNAFYLNSDEWAAFGNKIPKTLPFKMSCTAM